MSFLKEDIKHLIDLVGSRKYVAHLLDVSETELSYWCNPNHDRHIPIDHLVQLDALAGDRFLKTWARKRGYEIVKDDATIEAATNVFKTIGEFSKASGACAGVALVALADHDFTPNEKREVKEFLRPVKDSIDNLEKFLAL